MEQAALDVTFALGDIAPEVKDMGSRVLQQRSGMAQPMNDQLKEWKIRAEEGKQGEEGRGV
jgi:hypothetical protein